ncbi:fatty acyl-AMP ligase [Wenjunlia tyrosinilytica]|uniref:Acyl-CoA synthetase n=1 Tax=Wenjunlia tyrosinilytica TaxID=1544741 RepID=A0A917ZRN4_9ACTN|nr:fatty acyl-AMP ligase [Wenjunlia tyrosinilytica]GGO90204.1 acyl-CoA synthetase [Wenjunlia tyrosinilytica]
MPVDAVTQSPPEPTTLVELCLRRAASQPDRRMFAFLGDGIEESDSLTLAQLDARARAIATRLSGHAPPGARAVLSYPPGLEFVSAFFGCLYAGLVAVPAPPVLRAGTDDRSTRFRAIVGNCEPELVLSNASRLDRVGSMLKDLSTPRAVTPVATDEIDGLGPLAGHRWSPPRVDPDTVAYLQYTSGTTGLPRGVVLTHGNVLHNLALILANGSDAVDDRDRLRSTVSWLPVFHDMGLISGVLQPLYVGYDTALMPSSVFVQQPVNWLRAISDRRAGIGSSPGFGYELCVRQVPERQLGSLDLSGWGIAVVGDEPVRADMIDGFTSRFAPCGFRREAFFPSYGMAESTVMVSGGQVESEPVIRRFDAVALAKGRVQRVEDETESRRLVGLGRLHPSMAVAVVDPATGEPCAPDEVGEILASGPSIGTGYWNEPEESARAFRTRVRGHGDRCFLRTGSVGFMDGGQLFALCRVKDLIVVDGTQHYPYDIETTAAASHPSVRDGCCCAFVVEDDRGTRLVLLAEINSRHRVVAGAAPQSASGTRVTVGSDEIEQAIREAVFAEHGLRTDDVLLLKAGSLPFTTSGKLQRAQCRHRYRARAFTAVVSEAPRTGLPEHHSGRS